MNIVHLLWALETGGVETMLVDIVNEQVKQENVAIFVVNDLINTSLLNKIDKQCHIELFRRKIGGRSLWPWLKLNLLLIKYRPDIIHFHLEGMRKMVLYPALKVFTIHNMHTSGAEYSKYDALYAISDTVRIYTEHQGYKSTTIYNGIHAERIKQRDGLLRSSPPFKLVCVGRLYTPHKGQDLLIQAMSLLKDRNITAFHLDLIGDGESGGELERMINVRGLGSQVTILGNRNRDYVYEHLCDYDLYILPSRSEGFGLSVAEAVCAKIPVMICDLPGPLEIIDNGNLGMVFKNGDVESLANQLESFFNHGYDKMLIKKAYDYVYNHFNVQQTARQYINEYKNLLEE
jgi:glycosyltransferase involved in cell wall biosynthesis